MLSTILQRNATSLLSTTDLKVYTLNKTFNDFYLYTTRYKFSPASEFLKSANKVLSSKGTSFSMSDFVPNFDPLSVMTPPQVFYMARNVSGYTNIISQNNLLNSTNPIGDSLPAVFMGCELMLSLASTVRNLPTYLVNQFNMLKGRIANFLMSFVNPLVILDLLRMVLKGNMLEEIADELYKNIYISQIMGLYNYYQKLMYDVNSAFNRLNQILNCLAQFGGISGDILSHYATTKSNYSSALSNPYRQLLDSHYDIVNTLNTNLTAEINANTTTPPPAIPDIPPSAEFQTDDIINAVLSDDVFGGSLLVDKIDKFEYRRIRYPDKIEVTFYYEMIWEFESVIINFMNNKVMNNALYDLYKYMNSLDEDSFIADIQLNYKQPINIDNTNQVFNQSIFMFYSLLANVYNIGQVFLVDKNIMDAIILVNSYIYRQIYKSDYSLKSVFSFIKTNLELGYTIGSFGQNTLVDGVYVMTADINNFKFREKIRYYAIKDLSYRPAYNVNANDYINKFKDIAPGVVNV